MVYCLIPDAFDTATTLVLTFSGILCIYLILFHIPFGIIVNIERPHVSYSHSIVLKLGIPSRIPEKVRQHSPSQ